MNILETNIDVNDQNFKENYQFHRSLANELSCKIEKVKLGGGPKYVERHLKRSKLLPRQRIEKIIDPGSTLLELSPLAAHQVYDFEVQSAGIVCAIGRVHGIECMFMANDATVKGGTYFPLTVKKHLRAQEIALENSLPCIYLVDSGGAYLPMQDQVFADKDHFGRIFFNQAQMSAKAIPQISAVLGPCTAGGAYVPSMCDENIIVEGNGTVFLAGPPLVEAATGEKVSAQELGGAKVHATMSGVIDHMVFDELSALEKVRDIVENLHFSKKYSANISLSQVRPPEYDPQELYGVIPKNAKTFYDVREIVARLVDGSFFHEFKQNYATTLVCGFARIYGMNVGIVANNGVLFGESALKGAHFVQLCGNRRIPLIFLQNITGFMVGKKYEQAGIAKDGAKMVNAVSTVNVPKLTLIIGGSFGAGNYGMCGRAYAPRFLWMWPNAKISVMGGEQAAGVLSSIENHARTAKGKEKMTEKEKSSFEAPILEKYKRESCAYYSTARLWDDGIIDPVKSREVLALGLCAATRNWDTTKFDSDKNNYGLFRM